MYGPSFGGLATTVRIIAFAQLLNGLTGVAVEVLQVTGRASAETRALAIAAGSGVTVACVGFALFELAAPTAGALLFAVIVAIRSVSAGALVYRPLLSQRMNSKVVS